MPEIVPILDNEAFDNSLAAVDSNPFSRIQMEPTVVLSALPSIPGSGNREARVTVIPDVQPGMFALIVIEPKDGGNAEITTVRLTKNQLTQLMPDWKSKINAVRIQMQENMKQ